MENGISGLALEEADCKIKEARDAYRMWSILCPVERRKILFSLKNAIFKYRHDLADIIIQENGRVRFSAEGLIFEMLNTFFIVEEADRLFREKKFIRLNKLFYRDKECYIVREPIGVIGIIAPSTAPFFESLQQIIQATIMGNTVVVKLPPESSLLQQKLEEIIGSSEIPKGVINIIKGGADLGKHMVASEGIDKIVAFGRRTTGEEIIRASAPTIKPLVLGLGDSGSAIVLDEINIERTAAGIVYGAFCNSGQTCSSIRRAILVKPVGGAILEALINKTKRLNKGKLSNMDSELGRVMPAEAERFFMSLKEAESEGAQVVTGGGYDSDKNIMQPVIVSNVTKNMKIAQEEFMAPYLCVLKADSIEEAVEIANSTVYGLSASIWGSDIAKAQDVASGIKAGVIWINDTQFYHYRFPFGGLKQSGYGKVSGMASLEEYVNKKLICVDRGKKYSFHWFPYNSKKIHIMRKMLALKHDPSVINKIRHIISLFFGHK